MKIELIQMVYGTIRHNGFILDRSRGGMTNYWLFKTDPDTYAWQSLLKVKRERWDGVANPLALKHLRSVQRGDQILIYHTGDEKAVVGIAEALGPAYPDPSDSSGKLVVIDIAPRDALKRAVTLSEIKSNPKFKNWALVRMSRLSVMPASAAEWGEVMRLSRL